MGNQGVATFDVDTPLPEDLLAYARRIQIGEFLRRELERRNWSQAKLAEKAGCDQTTISKIINAKHPASKPTLDRVLVALGLPVDTLDKLPSTEFQAGTDGFQLKCLLIRAVLTNEIPNDPDACARDFITYAWGNPEYRELPRTPNVEDAVWASCVAEGYFTIDDGRYRVDTQIRGQLRYFFTSYISHAASVLNRIGREFPDRQASIFSQLAAAFDNFETSVNNPELLCGVFEEVNLTLAGSDRLVACILGGYSQGFGFFLRSFVGGALLDDQYELHVQPLLEGLLAVLRRATTECLTIPGREEWHSAVDSYVEELGLAVTAWAEGLRTSDLPGTLLPD